MSKRTIHICDICGLENEISYGIEAIQYFFYPRRLGYWSNPSYKAGKEMCKSCRTKFDNEYQEFLKNFLGNKYVKEEYIFKEN